MTHSVPAHPDDGQYRFIVTPAADGLSVDSSSPSASGSDAATSSSSSAPAGGWSVSPDHLDEANDATLLFQDGIPGFIDSSGSFVALTDAEGSVDPVEAPGLAAGDGESFGHPLIDALAGHDDVTSVAAIGDGSFAIVTTSPDVVEHPDLMVMDDLPLGFTEDTYGGYQWAFDNTGHNLDSLASPPPQIADADVDGVEAATLATGLGVVVAVVDSGVDFGHPDLAGKSWVNTDEDCTNGIDDDANGYIDDCRGWDFAADDNVPFLPGHHKHGTHVAGIIAATAGNNEGIAGLAPDVQIMDLSVSPTGSMTTSSIVRAIRYAVDNGADIVNLSLGTSPGAPIAAVTPMIDAVHYAEAAGVLLVIAAGNNGVDLSTAPVYPASINATNVLTVGASSPAETKASFSNYGTVVDVFAPGELILSTIPNGDYSFMSGTSQATPITVAVAALVLEQRPDADPVAVINQLVGTADELPAYANYAPSSTRLNAARAVGAAPGAATDGAPPVVVVGGLADASSEAVAAEITLNAPGGQYEQPFHWEASLVSVRPDGIYAIIGHPVSIDGTSGATNDRGAVTLGQELSMAANLVTSLPDGTYGIVVEAVPRTDSTVRLGDAFITTFVVGDPAPPTPTDPGSGTPTDDNPGTGTPTDETTTTTVPSGDPVTQPTYPEPTYPAPTYPQPTYLPPTYPEPTYPAPTYPQVTYPAPNHPEVTYPAPTYPEVTYPAPTYPEVTYPAPTYPE
ncbi:MAG: S8 family serine peptidase, partial [Actinomycetia bacterium]|nr:S8 family serine peptidase [Actinomycetes bacterium]